MINIDDKTRRLSQATIVIGYKQENKAESIEFEIPDYLKEYGKKICFKTKDGKVFSKLFDNTTSNIFTFTRTETQYGELNATIEFFKTENEDMVVYKTSMLHIIFNESIICEDEVQPDEPKIPILESLIEKVTDLNNTITENEETRNNNENTRISNENSRISNETQRDIYYTGIQNKVNAGEFNGATFTPSVDKDGNISWTNNKGLENPSSQNIRGPQGIQGAQGEPFKIKKTYSSIEAMQADFDNMEVGDYVMIVSSVELEDNAKLYTKTETEWVFITDFSGATGIQGEQGPQGIQGIQGERGIGISKLEVIDGSLWVTLTDNTKQNAGLIITDEVKQWIVNQVTNNAKSDFNTYYDEKVTDFDNHVTVKTNEFNTNATNKVNEYNQNAENLINRVVECEAENERLRNDIKSIALSGEASGENIHIEDSSNARFNKFEIGGNHKQETREGYNILDLSKKPYNEQASSLNGATVTQKNGILTIDATSATDFVTVRSVWTSYTNSTNIKMPKGNYYTPLILNINKAEGGESVGQKTGNITLEEDCVCTQWFYNVGKGQKIELPLFISNNQNKITYEQYGASPSPDYPSEIKTVKDSVKVKVVNNDNTQEQTITMPVQQEMLKGDYIVDVEHHEWKKLIFDENSDINCVHSDGTFQFVFLKYIEATGATTKVICNMSKYWNMGAFGENGCFISWNGYFCILCKENEFGFNADMTTNEAISHFKEKLTQNNLICYYQLTTQTELDFTNEQKAVAKQIKETLHTYKNITNISAESAEVNPIINVKYLKDTEKYIEDKITTALTEINANN